MHFFDLFSVWMKWMGRFYRKSKLNNQRSGNSTIAIRVGWDELHWIMWTKESHMIQILTLYGKRKSAENSPERKRHRSRNLQTWIVLLLNEKRNKLTTTLPNCANRTHANHSNQTGPPILAANNLMTITKITCIHCNPKYGGFVKLSFYICRSFAFRLFAAKKRPTFRHTLWFLLHNFSCKDYN